MKKMLLLTILFIIGCQRPQPEWSRLEHNYIVKAEAQPSTFTIPKSSSNDAWGRAQSFIAQYSDTKIVTATDYVLETGLTSDLTQCTYKARRTPLGDSVTFTLECIQSSPIVQVERDRNEHVWAYYVVTGEQPPSNRIVMRDAQ
jgi:hypothetical protein